MITKTLITYHQYEDKETTKIAVVVDKKKNLRVFNEDNKMVEFKNLSLSDRKKVAPIIRFAEIAEDYKFDIDLD